MDRFCVDPFATARYGEDPRFGWRVAMRHVTVPFGGILLATFETEAEAQTVADMLNEHNARP